MARESDIAGRLIRRARRIGRVYRIVQVVFIVSVFVMAPSWGYVMVTLPASPHPTVNAIDYVFIASSIVWMLAFVAMLWLPRWANDDLTKRLKRVVETLDRLEKLKKEHPELVLLNEVTELLEEEKTEAASLKNLGVDILVNLFFTLFGFALSYTATKLGWLR